MSEHFQTLWPRPPEFLQRLCRLNSLRAQASDLRCRCGPHECLCCSLARRRPIAGSWQDLYDQPQARTLCGTGPFTRTFTLALSCTPGGACHSRTHLDEPRLLPREDLLLGCASQPSPNQECAHPCSCSTTALETHGHISCRSHIWAPVGVQRKQLVTMNPWLCCLDFQIAIVMYTKWRVVCRGAYGFCVLPETSGHSLEERQTHLASGCRAFVLSAASEYSHCARSALGTLGQRCQHASICLCHPPYMRPGSCKRHVHGLGVFLHSW